MMSCVIVAVFVLYLFYFLQLDMFATLRYLGLIGLPTFLCGNKLLSSIAARRSLVYQCILRIEIITYHQAILGFCFT